MGTSWDQLVLGPTFGVSLLKCIYVGLASRHSHSAGLVNVLYFQMQTSAPCLVEDKPKVQSYHQFFL